MRKKGSGLIVCTAALLAVAAPCAHAQSPPQQVGPQLVLDGITGTVDSQLRDQSCAELKFGSAGDNEPDLPDTPDKGNGLATGAPSTAPASLPTIVPFKTETESFNRRYWFAVAGGRLYFRSNTLETGIRQPWKEVPIPPCFYGKVSQIAADDDELVAIDNDRRIYTMNHALEDPSLFDWTSRWGPLFWSGSGHALPSNIQTWAWSVLSIHEDGTYRDGADNDHPVGEFKVSHVWSLRDGGRRLNFNDPWLARDQSYVMCGPKRDRFRAVDMAASGSTIFVMGSRGDMYTRLFDFDMSGFDPAFVKYAYEDQRGVKDPAVQLPAVDWIHQPKVPGRIASTITIEKRGRGAIERTLRVEGLDRKGRVGYWQKPLTATRSSDWKFKRTGRRLLGRELSNPRNDTSARGLAPSEERRYEMSGSGWRGAILDYDLACTPARLRVRLDTGQRFELKLHTVDGIRLTPRAPGLDSEPRGQSGAVEVPAALLKRADPAVKAWLDANLGGRRFTTIDTSVTTSTLAVNPLTWTFSFRDRPKTP